MCFVMSVFGVVKKTVPEARNTCFILVLILQFAMLVWHIFGQPVDRLKAMVHALGTLLEIIVISLTFASSLLNDYRHPEMAAAFGTAGPGIMLYVTMIPLVLEVYDSLFLPIRTIVKNGKADGQSMKTIGIALIFLPLTIVLKVFKIQGGGNINKMATVAKKTAKKTKVATKDTTLSQTTTCTKTTTTVESVTISTTASKTSKETNSNEVAIDLVSA